jgi:hypothetical protein
VIIVMKELGKPEFSEAEFRARRAERRRTFPQLAAR